MTTLKLPIKKITTTRVRKKSYNENANISAIRALILFMKS